MKTKALWLSIIVSVVPMLLAADPPTGSLIPRRPANKAAAKLPPDTPIDRVVIKFHEGTHLRLRGKNLVALTRSPREEAQLKAHGLTEAQVENDVRAVHALLAANKNIRGLARLFTASEDVLAARRTQGEERSRRELADLDLYYGAPVASGVTQAGVDLLVDTLNTIASVEVAYVQPPAQAPADIPPTTPNFQGNQGYLDAAPNGIEALYAWTIPGGRGFGTSIVDVEGAWRTTHEDLPSLFHQGGTQYNDLGWRNHGTAVLGVMVAPDNGYGVTGIANQASAGFEGIASQTTANAITNASIAAGLSGIVLIELHTPGPSTPNSSCGCSSSQCDFVPMEFFQAEFDAISSATAGGTIVVEAGGNGATDLDDAVYGGVFNRFVRDSGAILVGAGESYARLPTCFTNFGSRIDMHGWGWDVATLGYGGLFNPGDENQWYTAGFNGTSSASPIVTGAASSIIGVSIAFGQGYGYRSAEEIRQILHDTGTYQDPDPRYIGPLPDLRQAIPRILDWRPVANFTICCSGLVCNADASGSFDDGNIVSYDWDWDDGSSSSGGPAASHTYNANGIYTVTLTVTDNIDQIDATTQNVTVPGPTAPGSFAATASTPTSIALSWAPSAGGVAYYVIQRRNSYTGAWGPEQATTSTSFTDFGVSAGFTYQYRIKAVSNAGCSSAFAMDYATTVVFGPDLQRYVTLLAGSHIRDLRDAVDAWRKFANRPEVYPANPIPAGIVKAAHFVTNFASDPLPGVFTALNQARNTIGLPSFVYSGAPAPAVNQIVYLEHVQQLRDVMK